MHRNLTFVEMSYALNCLASNFKCPFDARPNDVHLCKSLTYIINYISSNILCNNLILNPTTDCHTLS
jgi:hypothetical protein